MNKHHAVVVVRSLLRRAGAILAIAALVAGCAAPSTRQACSGRTPVAAPAPATELAPSGCRTSYIDTTRKWNASGVLTMPGAEYRFCADANDPAAWTDWFVPATPQRGWSGAWAAPGWLARHFARAPSEPMFGLVCAVGGEDATAAVSIVSSLSARQQAEIFCFANDWPGQWFYKNNLGGAELTICRGPR